MRAKKVTLVLMVGMLGFAGLPPPSGFGGDKEEKIKFYENCIVREISTCKMKTNMLNSRSSNLRKDAEVKLQKAAFLDDHKEILIQELLDRQAALREHKIQVYLNSRFFGEIE
jgi:hypothetical protein